MPPDNLVPVTERVDQATRLATRIRDLINGSCAFPVLHAAYKLTTGVLNQTLTYDICVLPLALLGPFADRLDDIVLDVMHSIVGDGWSPDTLALLRLHKSHGGCSVPTTRDRAHTAFLSTVLRCPPSVTETPVAWTTSGVLNACQQSTDWLRGEGLWIDAWGMPRAAPPPANDTLLAERLPPISLPKRQPSWRRMLADIRAKPIATRIAYLASRGGDEGGTLLTASAGDMQLDLTDHEFRSYLRMRLQLPVCSNPTCQHRAAAGADRVCRQPNDPWGHHALLCKLGGGLTATHNAICSILLQATRAAGYSALKEQVVAELACPARKEPRVDVDAWGVAAEPRVLLDLTVTCPFAQRYADKDAAHCGELRKDKEYPARAGLAVTGVAVDVFGRPGPALQTLLARLGDLARQRDIDVGTQPRRWLHRWRVRISVELARGCARLFSSAESSSAPLRATPPRLVHTPATATAAAAPVQLASSSVAPTAACSAAATASAPQRSFPDA